MNNADIGIYCSNIKTINPATHATLQHVAENLPHIHIIIITEPWIGQVRADTQEKGTVHHPKWKVIAPSEIEKARVVVYVRKTSPFRVIPLLHLPYANELILPLEVSDNKSSFKLIAVYNPPSTWEASQRLINHGPISEPAIICGDLNLHSPDWDCTVQNSEEHTLLFQEWLAEGAFDVLNDPTRPTFHGSHFQYKTVIDLVFSNIALNKDNYVSTIDILDDTYFGSDHYPIAFTIYTQMTSENPNPILFIPTKERERWVKEIKNLLTTITQESPSIESKEQLDDLATKITKAFTDAAIQIGKPRSPDNAHAKHWWNKDLDDAICELRKQAQEVKETGNPYLIHRHHRMKKTFRAKVRYAKQHWATERLKGATSKTVWDFIKWYKHGGQRNRPLYSSPSNVPAPSDQDRAKIFTKQFFPDPPPVLPFNPSSPPETPRDEIPLTWEEIDNAIKAGTPTSAPGPSGITYDTIRWAWEAQPDIFITFYSKCLEIGHYLSIFRHSTTSVVPKLCKTDYTKPGSF